MNVNEHRIKIMGLGNVAPANAPLVELGKDIELHIHGNVLKVEEVDNQDGSIDRIYKVKIITIEI